MIAVNKSQRKIPKSLTSSDCYNSLLEVIDLSNPKHKGQINPKFYGAEDIRKKLKHLYHNKCAYCETRETEPEIEHYRPKKRVSEDLKNHNGYYWLAYEWSNLLPACHNCNKNGVKGNHFPIEGIRKYKPKFSQNRKIDLLSNNLTNNYLQEEKPLFLNPEIKGFNPFLYFKFDKTGFMEANATKNTFEYRQAEATIKIVKLNRDNLYIFKRKRKLEIIFNEYLTPCLVVDKENKDFKFLFYIILNRIKKQTKPQEEYSFFWNYVYLHFDDYITAYFKNRKLRIFLIDLYSEFKKNNK